MSAVYVLCAGELGAGHSPVGLYRTRPDAIAAARRRWPEVGHFVAGSTYGTWIANVEPGDVDEVWVIRFSAIEPS